jgi:quinol monooxygenase YgiN
MDNPSIGQQRLLNAARFAVNILFSQLETGGRIMSIVVLLDFRVKADAIEDSKKFFKKILPETRAYSGCQGLDVYINADDPTNFVFHERWQSKEHYQKYFAWRTGNGSMEEFGSKLAAAPSVRYFNREDI